MAACSSEPCSNRRRNGDVLSAYDLQCLVESGSDDVGDRDHDARDLLDVDRGPERPGVHWVVTGVSRQLGHRLLRLGVVAREEHRRRLAADSGKLLTICAYTWFHAFTTRAPGSLSWSTSAAERPPRSAGVEYVLSV